LLETRTISRNERTHIRLTLQLADAFDLAEVCKMLRGVKGVYDVGRSADLGRKALQKDSSVSM
jgi:hypothetical protein